MESIAASRGLVERTTCQRQPTRGGFSASRRIVCLGGGNHGRVGARESGRKIVPKSQLSGLEGALETAVESAAVGDAIGYQGVHHVGLLCSNLERSLEFYHGLLGLKINPDRPNKKLPYRGAWLWIGSEMIHLMELPNPDPTEGRPDHGGRDRHFCIGIEDLDPLIEALDRANVEYTKSMSGRPAVFFRDPDMNCLECVAVSSWR